MDEEFVELSDMSFHDLCDVIVPRHDQSAEAHRRRRALEILMARVRPERKPLRAWEGAYGGGEDSIKPSKKRRRRRFKP